MTNSVLALFIMALFAGPLSAQAKPKLDPKIAACVGRDVLAFGASVTQGTPAKIPLWAQFVLGLEIYSKYKNIENLPKFSAPDAMGRPRGYWYSPVSRFAGLLGAKKFTNSGHLFNTEEEHLGSNQIDSMLSGGKRAKKFESASLIVGVDAFYWDAIWNTCEEYAGTMHSPENQIRSLILEARERKKFLILGNVPIENPANVRISSDRTGVENLWYPPEPSCAASINETLKDLCTYENNCYILDMKKMVDDINCGVAMKTWNGSEYKYFDLRSDGVHLSLWGSRYISEQLYELLAARPPVCPEGI